MFNNKNPGLVRPGFLLKRTNANKDIGWGSYGKIGFSIYSGSIDADDIFDSETANKLNKYIFVGDDYAGWMIGYEITEAGFMLREFDHQIPMTVEGYDPKNIVDFIYTDLFERK